MGRQSSFAPKQRSRKSPPIGEPREKVTQPRDNRALRSSYPRSCAGIIEGVSGPANDPREFYILHRVVVRESAKTTHLRVVYDTSATAHSGASSLNECLSPGPPTQNQLWNVLVRARFHPVAIMEMVSRPFSS